jgi:hypothetical protein
VPPAHARAYEAGLSKAKLRLVAGAGHSPHVERPAETAAALAAFFKPAPARKAAAKAPPKRKAAARPAAKRRAAPAKARARATPRKTAKRGAKRRR